ncbi:MAG: hypothetical protein Q4C86_10925 [bacterium]|nr:hypothetical protein [bacterium]
MRLLTDDEVRRGGTRELFYGSDPMEMEDPQTIVPRASSVAAPGGDDVFREREESLISSFNQAQSSGVAPERAREDLRLARGMDVPFFVVNQSDRIRNSALLAEHREAYRPAFAKIARERPATAKFLSDPGNMLLAQNDVERLAEAEGLIDIAKRAHHRGVVETELSQLMGKKAIYGMTDEHVGGRIRELRAELDSLKDGPREGFASWVWSAVNTLPQMERQWLAGGGWGAALGAAAGAASATKYGALIPFPEEVVTVPLAMYYGGRRGYVAGAMKTAFEIETGAAYDEFLAVPGVSDEAARVAAVSVGIINSGIEALEAATLVSGFPGGKAALKKLVGRAAMKEALTDPTVAKALGAFAKRYAKGLTFETAQEMAQEVVNILGGRALKAYVGAEQESFAADAARVAAVGVESFKGYSLISAVGPTTSLARDARRVRHGRSAYRVLTESAKAADSLAASDMGPEAAREFTKEVMAGSSAEKVFIPGRTLAELHQSGHIQNYEEFVEETLGVPTEAAYEASELGSYLEVNTDALVFAPEPLRNELLREAKFSPEDLSENERTVVVQELQARREADLQAALIEADELRREDKQGALVRETIAAQMKIAAADYDKANAAQHKEGNGLAAEFAGGDVERLADTAGRVMEAVSKVSSREWTLAGRKMGPREWLAEQGLSISFGEAKGGLQQSVWHGSPHRFDKFSLEHIGSGEGAQAFGWGLYFAGNKEVSEWYRKNLSGGMRVFAGEEDISGYVTSSPELLSGEDQAKANIALRLGRKKNEGVGQEFQKARGMFASQVEWAREDLAEPFDENNHEDQVRRARAQDAIDKATEALGWLDANEDKVTVKESGQLFKVDIPDEADGNYLLWDEKVSEGQAQVLLEALSESDDFDGPVSNWVRKERMNDSSVTDYISEEDIADEYYPPDVLREHVETYTDFYEASGEYVYNQLADIFGSPKAASLWLKEHGVSGIKYLDGNSRGRGEGNYNYVIFDDQDARIQETFYQPVNSDVDGNSLVNVVDLTNKNHGEHWNYDKLKAFVDGLVGTETSTTDSKAIVKILQENARHIAGSSRKYYKTIDPSVRTDAVRNVKDLIESAVLIESMPNKKKVFITSEMTRGQRKNARRKNKQEVLHRLYVPLNIGDGNIYTARIVVFEEDGKVGFDPLDTQLYDVLIDKKDGTFNRSQTQTNLLSVGKKAPSKVSIHDLLKNVPDSQGVPYFTQGKRGGITFNRKTGESLVSLFRTADRSTFIHEMGHLILEDLIRYGYKADSDTEISRDLKTVLDYLGISNMDLSDLDKLDETQQARLKEAHEKWARAMEMYVMNGDSPSKALRPILQKMRMWLLDIYSNAKFSGEELTPEVQDVFDRLLATPQEIEESYIAEITIGDLIKENELLKERLKNFEQEKKREANNKFRLGEALGYDRGKSEGKRGAKFKRPGFDYKTKSRQEAMFERLQKREALLKDVEALLKGINHDVSDEKVIWSVQQEMLDKLAESRQIVDLHDTELDKKRPNRRRRKPKFAAVYPTQKMKMAASLMDAIRQDLGLDYKDINPADAPFMKLIERLEAAGMTLNDLRLSDAKLSEIAALAKEISEIHARGRREYEVWRAGIVERRNKINAECVTALDKTESKAKQGPITGPSDLPKQYDGVMGKAEKLKDWTYANTLGAIRLFDWIGHGLGRFDSAFSRYCVDEVNAAYDTKLKHIQERHDAMNAKMKELGITFHALSKKRAVGKYKYSVDELLSIYAAMQNDKSSQALIFGNMRVLIPNSWSWDNKEKHDAKPPVEVLVHIGECVKALSPQERELADYVIREYDTHYERMNNIFIANFNQGMMKEENYTPMRRLEYTSNHGLENADEAAYAKGVAAQAGAQKAGLERGFLNPRVIPGKEISAKHQAPVNLGLLSIWNTQVDAMEHTAAFARIGPDLQAVFTENFEDSTGRSYNIPKLIREKFGSGTWKAVQEYINLVNRDELTVGNDVFSRIANTLSKNMAYTYLAANIGTVLKQTTSIPRFLITAGPAQIGCAIGKYLQHPKQFLEDIYAMDPQMRDRVPNVFFSINKYDPTMMGDAQYAYKKSMDTLIAPISYMDRVVAAIGWKATYESNVKRGLSHEQAVRAAQRAVLLTQQSPMIKDAPMIWRQSGLARLLMIFTSDAAPVLGMTAYDLAQSVKRGDHPASLCNIAALMISAVAMKALVDGMPDDDNEESWGEWVLSAFSRQAVESIPLVGKELMSFWESFSGQGYKGTTYSAFVAPLSKLARGFDDMTAEDSDEISPYTGMSKFERGAWNAVEGMSLITTPLPIVGAKRLYLATKNAADEDFLKALQAIIGQKKTMKKYSIAPEI